MDWVLLKTEANEISANLTKGLLESNNIETVLRPSLSETVAARKFFANDGAWDVLVKSEQEAVARQLIAQTFVHSVRWPNNRSVNLRNWLYRIGIIVVLTFVFIQIFFG